MAHYTKSAMGIIYWEAAMIQYRCDLCHEVVNKKYLHIISDFPRTIRTYVTDNIGAKLCSFDGWEFTETHLCTGCCRKLAFMLPVIEPD